MQENQNGEFFEMAKRIAGRIQGQNTPEEDAVLSEWLAANPKNSRFYEELVNGVSTGEALQEMAQFNRAAAFDRFLLQTQPKRRPLVRYRFWAAATLLLGLLYAGYAYLGPISEKQHKVSNIADIAPGGNKAQLTLSSGQRIDLSSAQEGIVVHDSALAYIDGAELGIQAPPSAEIAYHTLETPKGGRYQVVLPDGSKVWLNADSRLVYPQRFADSNRIVELVGEAYFDIVNEPDRPFQVYSGGQRVDVLGTAFNINAYPDEGQTRTTLVRGAIKVRTADEGGDNVLLHPGEESIMEDGLLRKQIANVEAATSWKLGRFYFDNTPLDAMMRQLARWYNIDVTYEKGIPTEYFTGKMSQRLHLMEVLDFLEGSEIKFRLEHRTLVISKL